MELHVKWVVEYRPRRLTIQFAPSFEGTSDRVSESRRTNLEYTPLPDAIGGDLQMLEELCTRRADEPPYPPIAGASWQKQPGDIERFVTQEYIGRRSSHRLIFSYKFVHSIGSQENQRAEWVIAELPSEMQDLIRRIDEYALTQAQEEWANTYNSLAESTEVGDLVPPPADVFLSYRGEREDLADYVERVHDLLSSPEGSSFFRVFHDRTDLRSGKWRPQIKQQLEETDVFVPLLTLDYLDGPIAEWEFKTAAALKETHGRPVIIPVVAEGRFTDFDFLSKEQGVYLPIEADAGLFGNQMGRLRSLIVDSQIGRRQAAD